MEPQGEKLLTKLDRRDRVTRGLEVVVLLILMAINIFGLFRIESIIKSNQVGTIEARKANAARQDELKGYIKCIVLLRYDNPNLNSESPRVDVEIALDKCAKVN